MIKFKRIRVKIALAMLLTTALPLSVTSGIVIQQVNQQIEKDREFAENRIKKELKRKIQEFAEGLNETAYQIYSNSDLVESIALDKAFLSDSQTYDTQRDIHTFFLNIYNQSRAPNIMGIYILRLNENELLGDFFPNMYPRMDTDYFEGLHEFMARNGQQPYMQVIRDSIYQEPVFQFLYPIKYRGVPTGLLVIDLKEQAFHEMVEEYNTLYKGQIHILNPNGYNMYATDATKISKKYADSDSTHVVSLQTDLENSWKLVYSYEIDPAQLLFRNIAISMISLAGLMAMLMSLWLSFNITEPIVELQRKMSRIRNGDYDARVEVLAKDEIGYLGNQFNRMAETIQQMIEHDLKLQLMNQQTQIKALQAQISPHFLFNTLQMMEGIAEMNRVPELKLICQSLANMYRYNMHIDDEWVELREEIMHIRNYLVIINKRFPNTIRFRFDLSNGTMGARIPKLILQPIIENAVEHGLIPHSKERKLLKLSARIDERKSCIYLSVLDNGLGLEETRLAAIKELLADAQRSTCEDKSAIGLYNVHSRLKLICGSEYGIEIKSRRGKGTWVIYRLPLRKEEIV